MIWAVVKMILGLGAVLGVLLLLIHLCKRGTAGKGRFSAEGQVRLLTSKAIGPRKFVSLVPAPQTGQTHPSGILSNGVPGAMPPSGSPAAGS